METLIPYLLALINEAIPFVEDSSDAKQYEYSIPYWREKEWLEKAKKVLKENSFKE